MGSVALPVIDLLVGDEAFADDRAPDEIAVIAIEPGIENGDTNAGARIPRLVRSRRGEPQVASATEEIADGSGPTSVDGSSCVRACSSSNACP